MLYQLFSWLDKTFNIPGLGAFQFLTFRIAMAILLSLFIATVYGKKMILFLQKKQIGESVRELGLVGEQQKQGDGIRGMAQCVQSEVQPVSDEQALARASPSMFIVFSQLQISILLLIISFEVKEA